MRHENAIANGDGANQGSAEQSITDHGIAEAHYVSLFEHASEAIVSFRPREGTILDANVQARRMFGLSRGALLRLNFRDLFAAIHNPQIQWLIEQDGGSSHLYLEDLALQRPDGTSVPISLSCNWQELDGHPVAQVIIHDMTQQQNAREELRSYAAELEARVEQGADELKLSEDRYRTLFLQEQQRARHLQLINDVQGCALETNHIDEFLHRVTSAIQAHFRECDATFFLLEGAPTIAHDAILPSATQREYSAAQRAVRFNFSLAQTDATLREGASAVEHGRVAPPEHTELVVAAQAGGHRLSPEVGVRVPLNTLLGYALQTPSLPLLCNSTASEPRYRRLPETHRDPASMLCVAVQLQDDIIGVICLQSEGKMYFNPRDAIALQTVASIVAAQVHTMRVLVASGELQAFSQTLIGTMLHSLMVVDANGLIQLVNDRLCQTLRRSREELLNTCFEQLLGSDVVQQHDLWEALHAVTQQGEERELHDLRLWVEDSQLCLDLRLSRVHFRGQAQVVILLINFTQRWRQHRQLEMLNTMGRHLQSSLHIDRVLHIVMTCLTAGPALGFNRAFLLLFREGTNILRGVSALGPSSAQDAARIWREMSRNQRSLSEILALLPDEQPFTPLQERVQRVEFDLDEPRFARLRGLLTQNQTIRVSRQEIVALTEYENSGNARGKGCFADMLTAPEIAVAPLAAQDRTIGMVVVDNLYSGAPIENDDLYLLSTLAQQAALTLDNALTYRKLQKAQDDLVASARLAAVGEMAARVSHEIRNPLSTVGGFARNIQRKPNDAESVRVKSGVIVEEVERLEELLTDLLDMARPYRFEYSAQSLNELVERALLLADADIQLSHVEVTRQLAADLPLLMFDQRRMLQALLNIVRNAAQAMAQGGTLRVLTRLLHRKNDEAEIEIEIADTGPGIPEKAQQQMFDPFFSTKIRGSGLGLAVTRRIIDGHGGTIDVFSEDGNSGQPPGTVFIISMTLKIADECTLKTDLS